MSKRLPKDKFKASRPFLDRSSVAPKSEAEAVVFEGLVDFYRSRPPRHPKPEEIDVRKDCPEPWKLLLYRVGSSTLLAEYLETSQMSISRWLSGKGMPELTALKVRALAQSLGLPSPV